MLIATLFTLSYYLCFVSQSALISLLVFLLLITQKQWLRFTKLLLAVSLGTWNYQITKQSVYTSYTSHTVWLVSQGWGLVLGFGLELDSQASRMYLRGMSIHIATGEASRVQHQSLVKLQCCGDWSRYYTNCHFMAWSSLQDREVAYRRKCVLRRNCLSQPLLDNHHHHRHTPSSP